MKRKIIGISIVLLLLALIPSTSIATETPPMEDSKLLLKGSVFISEIENNSVHGLALRLFYIQSSDDEWTMGWVTLNEVIFPDGFFMIPIGKLTFVIGIVRGQGGLVVE